MDYIAEIEEVLTHGEISLLDLNEIKAYIQSQIDRWGTEGPARIM